jgi:hypothetical protein
MVVGMMEWRVVMESLVFREGGGWIGFSLPEVDVDGWMKVKKSVWKVWLIWMVE